MERDCGLTILRMAGRSGEGPPLLHPFFVSVAAKGLTGTLFGCVARELQRRSTVESQELTEKMASEGAALGRLGKG